MGATYHAKYELKAWGFNDAVILGIAHRLGKPLLTFDERLRRRAGRLGIKVLDV
jgi:predicted nucleic acid-binding protein